MYFLSLDFGTSALKLAVVSENLEIVQTASAAYPYILLPGEKVEIDPDRLWAACYNSLRPDRSCVARSDRGGLLRYVLALSGAYQGRRNAVLPEHHHATSTGAAAPQSDYIDRVVGNDRYASIAGVLPFPGGVGAMTFIWFNQNERDPSQAGRPDWTPPDLCPPSADGRMVRRSG